MIITNPVLLDRFVRNHAQAKEALLAWAESVESEVWSDPHDALALHPNARHIGRKRLVFKINGNRYRLIAYVNYEMYSVEIRFIGTHAQYDRINARKV